VLRSRLSHGPEGEAKAEILGDLADALDTTGRADEALGLRLQALQDAPGASSLHRAAAEQAARLGQSQRYVDSLTALIERARRKADSVIAADLLIRSAEIIEREFGDLDAPRRCTAASRPRATAWSRRGWAWPASPPPAATRPVRSSCSSGSRARPTTR
jgi:hypothetical protein